VEQVPPPRVMPMRSERTTRRLHADQTIKWRALFAPSGVANSCVGCRSAFSVNGKAWSSSKASICRRWLLAHRLYMPMTIGSLSSLQVGRERGIIWRAMQSRSPW